MVKFLHNAAMRLLLLFVLAVSSSAYAQIPAAPAATAATMVTSEGFTTNWNAVTGATGYRLDVSTSETFGFFRDAATLNETFTALPFVNGDYNGTFTGASGIEWTVYLGRVNYTGSNGNMLAVRPNATANGYIQTGVIQGGIASLSFVHQKKGLGTEGGNFKVSVLTGSDFSTVTDLGTFSFSTVSGNFINNSINITQDCKIRIDNIATYQNAYLAVDDIIINTNAINEPSYVAGYENLFVAGTSQTVMGLTQNTNYHYRVRAEQAAETSVNSGTVTVATTCAETTPPVITAPEFCASATVANLIALSPGLNLKWYSDLTGGTALQANDAITTRTYYATSSVDGCESARVAVAVTVKNLLSLPDLSRLIRFCGPATVGDLTDLDNIAWYSQQTGGTPLAANSNLPAGVSNLYAAKVDGTCEGDRLKIWVIINSLPTVPALPTQEFCGNAVAGQLIDEMGANTTLNWFASPDGAPLNPADVLSNTTYYVSRTVRYAPVGGHIAGPLLMFNFDRLAAELNGNIPSGGTLNLASPSTLMPGPNTVLSPLNNVYGFQVASGGISLSNPQYLEFTIAPEPDFAYSASRITVKTPPSTAFITQGVMHQFAYSINGSDFILAGSPVTTTAGNQTVEFNYTEIAALQSIQPGNTLTLRYYASGVGGAVTQGVWGIAGSSGLIIHGLVQQPVYFCESPRTPVNVVVNPVPAAPVANGEYTVCTGSTVADLDAAGDGLKWYATATATDTLASTEVLTAATYYVSQTVDACESGRTPVPVIIINPVATGAATQQFNAGQTLADLDVTGPGIIWYADEALTQVIPDTTVLIEATYFAVPSQGTCRGEVLAVTVMLAQSPEGTLFVKKGATGDGSSWTNALGEVAEALKIAKEQNDLSAGTVTQIWVAGGRYMPVYNGVLQATNDKNRTFVLVKDVKMYGGFAGTETLLTERNLGLTANASILDGDFNSNDVKFLSPSNPNIWLYNNTTENAWHVVIAASADPAHIGNETVMDGFTIKGAGTTSSISAGPYINGVRIHDGFGGGIVVKNANPVLSNLIITKNSAVTGGSGVHISVSDPTFVSSPLLTNILISENGGNDVISCQSSASVFTNITMASNQGGINFTGVGGDLVPALRNSIVYGNRFAGTFTGITIHNSLVQGNTDTANGNITGNPLFVDAANGDFRLKCGSPALNAGSNAYFAPGATPNLSGYTTDVEGMARIQDTTIDMGAYEAAPFIPVMAPAAVSPQSFCGAYTVAALMADVMENATDKWYATEDATEPLAEDVALATGTYYVSQLSIQGCESTRTAVSVIAANPVAAGAATQQYNTGETLADLEVTGPGIVWYADEALTQVLPATTVLTEWQTYYAVPNEGTCAGEALAVTVDDLLGKEYFDNASFKYYPNPVKDKLTMSYSETITGVEVYNMLGQAVIKKAPNAATVMLDMSQLQAATYLVKVHAGNSVQTIKLIKE